MNAQLHRYWFIGDADDPFGVAGIGVTAFTEEDARQILIRAFPTFAGRQWTAWQCWSLDMLRGARVVEDVDVQLLDRGHVIPNMGLVVDRGVWWPRL